MLVKWLVHLPQKHKAMGSIPTDNRYATSIHNLFCSISPTNKFTNKSIICDSPPEGIACYSIKFTWWNPLHSTLGYCVKTCRHILILVNLVNCVSFKTCGRPATVNYLHFLLYFLCKYIYYFNCYNYNSN